jgi:hypothetical protein
MKCSICKQEIELVPSAAERAKKFGGTASHYTHLFTEHAACIIQKRTAETLQLIQEAAQ